MLTLCTKRRWHHSIESVPVAIPRNMKQLRNMRYKQLQRFRLSRDDLYNIHEIAYVILVVSQER